MIVVVDYGIGNLGSILNMLKKIGVKAILSRNADDLRNADKLILPGVGAFDTGMKHLLDSGLVETLNDLVLNAKKPTIGLCLGMQLLTKKSEEGNLPGLGWIDAETVRFRFDGNQNALKIPHMGWNNVTTQQAKPLLNGLEEDARFYFVHSYHIVCHHATDVLGVTHYGFDFPAIIQKENIMGTQFHPEKSHKFGMRLLKNFAELT